MQLSKYPPNKLTQKNNNNSYISVLSINQKDWPGFRFSVNSPHFADVCFLSRSAIQRVVSEKTKPAVYKPRSLNVKVLRDTILPGQNPGDLPQPVTLINGSVAPSFGWILNTEDLIKYDRNLVPC